MLLCGLLARGYKPEFYTFLEEEMFELDRDKKVFKALKQGYKHEVFNLLRLREATGLSASETVELSIAQSNFGGWVTEKDILEFVEDYRERKLNRLVKDGMFKEALEYKTRSITPSLGVIEDYKRSLKEKRSRADDGLLGLPTGISQLDRETSGMQPAKVWIVGGYNAYGKTYFMTNMVNRLVDMDRRVCVITLEMTKEDIIDRVIAERLSMSVYELAKSKNRKEIEGQVEKLEEHIKKDHLVIIDSLYEIEDLISKIKLENANKKIDVLFLDFIQLVRDSKSKSSYEALSRIASRLQEMAKELGVCCVILSQISNEAQKDGNSGVYGFKGAGEIGQVADVAIKIKRYKDEVTEEFNERYDLDLVKNRSGRTGLIPCKITFPGGSISQEDLSERVLDSFGVCSIM